MCMLKSPVINRWLEQRTADSRNAENSWKKTIVMTAGMCVRCSVDDNKVDPVGFRLNIPLRVLK